MAQKHLSKSEYNKLTLEFALDEDPDDLGVKPTLTKERPLTELEEDQERVRNKRKNNEKGLV